MKLTPTTGLLGFGAQSLTGLTYSAVPNTWSLGSAGLNYSDFEQLKTFKGGACVNAFLYQWEKNLLNMPNVESNQWEAQTEKFKNPSGHARGCVSVSWNKETWEGGNWKGTIRYEWLYTIGDEVMVSYGLWTTEHNIRTIYINKRTKANAWKLWKIQKEGMPKDPSAFFGGKEHWGFNPDFAIKSEAKWFWNEDEYGSESFSDQPSNYWSNLFTWGPHLNQLDKLVKKQGRWTQG